ncbi:MAG: low affinity iron permease family protein [Novosphingobium pentaromativorans]|uniref:Low affinity iron permease family protein n=1 Tax=Novosphingobium pentaromativorans TaxID=205844 RepID=A0A2W5NT02_9SPHN|nr:low affinity iron permease family protein [Novosphingobium panipatense]PZQ56691.1 MAG: low affinity iron permease family protein [Novosphingobium pentaromativorans]
MRKSFTAFANFIAGAAGKAQTFIIALAVVAIWAVSGPIFQWSDTWQLVINTGTTIVTFLMVFLIQNSQNRDAAAFQAKLDELLRALETARDDFIGIEHLSVEEIERLRRLLEEETGECKDGHKAHASVDRLLSRY